VKPPSYLSPHPPISAYPRFACEAKDAASISVDRIPSPVALSLESWSKRLRAGSGRFPVRLRS